MNRVLICLMVILTNVHLVLGQERTIGLFSNSAEAERGYLLYAPSNFTSTYLINNCGQLINEWESEFTPGLSAYLNENGGLIRTGVLRNNNTFVNAGTGGIIQRFSWDGLLEWEVQLNNDSLGLHHDIHLMPNGNILAIAWERILKDEALILGRKPELVDEEVWAERIIEIKPLKDNQFEVVWEWKVMDHIVQDVSENSPSFGIVRDSPNKINFNYPASDDKDWLHINSVYYDEVRDEVILSVREFDEFWIIDHSTTTEEASSNKGGNSGKGGNLLFRWGNDQSFDTNSDRVFLNGQHDVEKEKDGTIFLFNNRTIEEGGSQIVGVLPKYLDGQYIFEDGFTLQNAPKYYLENSQLNFTSEILSSIQVMQNGNLLICQGDISRFIEYTPNEDIVWDYIGPVSIFGPNDQGSNVIGQTFKIIKYPIDDPRFEGLDLSIKQDQIELDPLPFDCDLFTSTDKVVENVIDAYFDVFTKELVIRGVVHESKFAVHSIAGIKFLSNELLKGENRLDLSELNTGLYILTIEGSSQPSSMLFTIY